MQLRSRRCLLRPYAPDDVEALQAEAGTWEVARWMTRAFPHPYTAKDALEWIGRAAADNPTDNFAIEFEGELAGGVGIRPLRFESEGVAEFGYWLGKRHWGKGIASEAASLLAAHAFEERGLRRLEAYVFAPNVASARVLAKCGFTREGILRNAVTDREGRILDAWLYALLAPERNVNSSR